MERNRQGASPLVKRSFPATTPWVFPESDEAIGDWVRCRLAGPNRCFREVVDLVNRSEPLLGCSWLTWT
jgi:hypothetical protein